MRRQLLIFSLHRPKAGFGASLLPCVSNSFLLYFFPTEDTIHIACEKSFLLSVSRKNSSVGSEPPCGTYMLLLDMSTVFRISNTRLKSARLITSGYQTVERAIAVFLSAELSFLCRLNVTRIECIIFVFDGIIDGDIVSVNRFQPVDQCTRVGNNSTEVTSPRARKGCQRCTSVV